MNEYIIEVNQDGSNKSHRFIVQSGIPIDKECLLAAGLIMDGGASPEELEPIVSTAECYVSVLESEATK